MRHYVVTLKNHGDLANFYDEMETAGTGGCCPERICQCAIRRPLSRNTHYYLTDEEAVHLREDERVLAVELLPSERGIGIMSSYQQSANWDRGPGLSSSHKNWGLRRCVEIANPTNWGVAGGSSSNSDTITVTASGRNVDVIIVDGHMDPTHPEFAVNSDGTGGSRVIQLDWFAMNPQVLGIDNDGIVLPSGQYIYQTTAVDDNHGAHVAGTACGNTHGYARSANIYNINFNYPTPSWEMILFDYIRAFHLNKLINPATGYKNPTITNHSWSFNYFSMPITNVTSVNYRGILDTNAPFSPITLNGYGVRTVITNVERMPARIVAVDADIVDTINDGIIVIAAAGNANAVCDPGGIDSGNFYAAPFQALYNQGATPGSANGVICVGSASNWLAEPKSTFSNCGPRIDVYAPGSSIVSPVNTAGAYGGTVQDPRSASHHLTKISGTSMASPQVTGTIACLAEQFPRITQAQALAYIQSTGIQNIMADTGGGLLDPTDLQGSPNRYLFHKKERLASGQIYPKLNKPSSSTSITRGPSGMVWPRQNITYYR